MRSLLMVAVAGLVGGCAAEPPSPSPESAPSAPASEEDESVDRLAESYVRLVLALGEHQPDYVDAYIGPPEWRQAAREEGATLGEIRDRATADLAELPSTDPDLVAADDIEALRLAHLRRSYEALIARVDLLSGVEMTFDEESRALYDAVAPSRDEAHFRAILERLRRHCRRARGPSASATRPSAPSSRSRPRRSTRCCGRRSTPAASGPRATSSCRPKRASPSST